ncbi:short chain dehydrogenase family protein [Clostridioides difficile CD45]|uniref:SDR family NAD(P)-dependent oxidoreductase n=1 Tax=Clostridioides difficile TaxID=1496 RepID=UPI00038CFAC3|nr:SDR family oxidoreductase [Clostridioides difficile]EQE60338.1 short chain dehydrogenase family protein [Clostridioides difficile CD45]EQK76128.1 short chain dehydrogenase family protein [Clostridioides difficile CD113]MCI4311698.1 SDR family oxidoreductase [Clostridioides difficile]MCK1921823.1 SDR family oxidoreductase [Clostridioides difficile]MCM3843580.1 SDR family oxidoreductase [Clostridioides difficile]
MQDYVLITGASSGIGEAFAYAYAKAGRNVLLVSRSEDKLKKLSKNLEEKYNVLTDVIAMDLSKEHSGKELYHAVEEKGLLVTVIINNAGFATKGLFTDTDYQQQHNEILLNVSALTEITYFFIQDMVKRGTGTIINIASAASFNPLPFSAVYAATKSYVLSFTESVSFEYKDKGIRVLAVCPGATDTHFFDNYDAVVKKLRKPQDVVDTTFKALQRKNIVCTDGIFCKSQVLLHRIVSRKFALKIFGNAGKNTWEK